MGWVHVIALLSSIGVCGECRRNLLRSILDSHKANREEVGYVIDVGATFSCDSGLDSCQCFGLLEAVTLETSFGKGDFGEVFKTRGNKYVVKVQTKKITGPLAEYEDYSHECDIMKQLQGVSDNLHVPRCLALCKKDNWDVIVMDFMDNVGDMQHVAESHLSDEAMYKLGYTIYSSTVAMLAQGVNNADQRDANILAASDGAAQFIDMGEAHTEAELFKMCETGAFHKVTSFEAALGKHMACRVHIDVLNSAFLRSSLGSVPRRSLPAMQGLAEAFCANPSTSLVRAKFWSVYVGEDDTQFRKALRGDQMLLKPRLEKRGDGWFKVDDEPFKNIKVGPSHAPDYKIPADAQLVAITRAGSMENVEESSGDLAKRKDWGGYNTRPPQPAAYIFVKTGYQLVREQVQNKLTYAAGYHKRDVHSLIDKINAC